MSGARTTSSEPLTVAVLGPEDWRVWRRIRLAALAESPMAFLSRLEDWQGEGDTEERWRARLAAPGSTCLVALRGSEPCGMVSGTADREGRAVTWLESLWVKPEARGTGVVDRLVQAVAEGAREQGHSAVMLEVRESNTRAAAAYRRLGFAPTGEVRVVAGHRERVLRRRVASMTIPLGWRTDLAVLRLGDSTVTEHGDHLVVRTPTAPTYHWGNFVFVTDPSAVDDAERWLARFEEALPALRHRAVGLVSEPTDMSGWRSAGLGLELSDVLVRSEPVAAVPLPNDYTVRALETADDWERSTRLRIDSDQDDPQFEADVTSGRRGMVEAGHTRWFGAFEGLELVAELGIVDCGVSPDGHLARYQSVLTAPDHRRRGLTSHLLGVASRWAGRRGCDQWVIVADDGTDANRLYRAHGFEPTARSAQVYRPAVVEEPSR